MSMFFLGVCIGVSMVIVLTVVTTWHSRKRLTMEASRFVKDLHRKAMARHSNMIKTELEGGELSEKWQAMIREHAEKHKAAIQMEALEVCVGAIEQSKRTGKPVQVEFSGVQYWVTPPNNARSGEVPN